MLPEAETIDSVISLLTEENKEQSTSDGVVADAILEGLGSSGPGGRKKIRHSRTQMFSPTMRDPGQAMTTGLKHAQAVFQVQVFVQPLGQRARDCPQKHHIGSPPRLHHVRRVCLVLVLNDGKALAQHGAKGSGGCTLGRSRTFTLKESAAAGLYEGPKAWA